MNSLTTTAGRIILVFARRFAVLGCLSVLGMASAQAQGTYKIKLGIDYKGGLYTVSAGGVGGNDRIEVPVSPAGILKVYARAIPIPGVSGQALLDLQIYESRGGNAVQLSSMTMPVYLASENTADLDSKQGKLKINAYVEDPSAPAPAPAAAMAAPAPAASSAPIAAPRQSYSAPTGYAAPTQQAAPVAPRRPAPQISLPAGVRPVAPEPAPAGGAAPRSGAYSPVPAPGRRTSTAQASGGSCHDLSIPQEG